jgi:1,5-anhydro-D-fructose reductase (1,5-anhydro-D-mannitol-forming)
MQTLRFSIIGTSGHANRVAAPALLQAKEAELLGAVGSSSEKGAEFSRQHLLPKVYKSFADVLTDKDVEAVWIASPNHLHSSMAIACAEAGKHILVEKPLSTSKLDALKTVEAARSNGVTMRIGCQHRFRPAHQHLFEMIRENHVGQIGFFRIHRFWKYPYFEDMDPVGPPIWRRSLKTSGGWIVNDIGTHLIDLMLWMSGAKGRLIGAGLASQRFSLETEDSAAIMLTLENNGIGIIETSAANESPGSRIEIYGQNGWIRADNTLSGEGIITSHSGPELRFEPVGALEPYLAEIADFVRAIQGGTSIGADGDAAVANVTILEQLQVSGVRLSK